MLRELLTTYWSQLTLLILGGAYFIKRAFDKADKRIEIDHTLFQQNRIIAVNEFYRNYAKAELMWSQLQIWNILQNTKTADEIDAYIWPPMNDLKKSILELSIYFLPQEHRYFEKAFKSLLMLNNRLSALYYMANKDVNIMERVNSFEGFKEKAFKDNEQVLLVISENVRYAFSQKTQRVQTQNSS